MLVLLPPSETKRDGGDGAPLDLGALSYPQLNARRRALVRALKALSRDPDAAAAALKLGRTQLGEIARNRALTTSGTMPAVDRYTGVLYDALNAPGLSETEREFAGAHVMVHSALFGPVGALDPLPAYRMSHNSRLPEISLGKHWGDSISKVLAGSDGLMLDFRSEAYVAFGAATGRPGSYYLRVVTEAADGRTRALNHFNKKSKGELTRAIVQNGVDFSSVTALLDWADGAGIVLRPAGAGVLELVVEEIVAPRRSSIAGSRVAGSRVVG